MLSHRIYTGIEYFMSLIGTPLGIVPFSWCPSRQMFLKSRLARCFCVSNRALFFSWSIYLVFQIFRHNYMKDLNNLYIIVAFATGVMIPLESLFLSSWYEDCLLLEINSILVYLRRVKDQYIVNTKRTKVYINFVELLLVLQFGLVVVTLFVECVFTLVLPTAPLFPGNVVPNYWPFPIRYLLVYFLPIYLPVIAYMSLYFQFVVGIIYGTLLMPFVLHELHLGRKNNKSYGFLRRLPFLTLEYRASQIVQARVNDFRGRTLIPSQTLCGCIFVFSSFVIIKQRSHMEIPAILMMLMLAVCSAVMWGLALHLGGYVSSNAVKLLNSWKHCKTWRNTGERKYMRKFLRSCRPLVISYGKMYTIRKLTVLGYFRGLVKCLMRALLTMETNK